MKTIINILNRFGTIGEKVKIELSDKVVRKNLLKGELLLEQGSICRYLYILENGFARGYYFREGKYITSWFAFANDVVSSMYSFVSQKPSYENIEILEDSILYCISYEQLQDLYQKFPEFNLIGRLLTEKYYIALEERILSLQSQSAQERYKNLLKSKPQLLQHASLGQIASYLGVSPETLSRIRAKI
jgi:CRP/FNR family transcriptional regulator, anaerobic regulatory protein